MPRFRSSWFLSVIWLIMLVVGGEAHASTPMAGSSPQVVVNQDGIDISWRAPSPDIQYADGLGVVVSMPGFESLSEPGFPQVPMTSILIAIPPGSRPALEFKPSGIYQRSLTHSLAMNPVPDGLERDASGAVTGKRNIYPDEGNPFTPMTVELETLGVMRGVHLARLVFYPVLPIGGGIQVTPMVEVEVRFNSPAHKTSHISGGLDPLQESLKTMVANPLHFQPVERVLRGGDFDVQSPDAVTQAALIEVSEPGITLVTYQDLLDAGFPVSLVNPKELQLWQGGSPVDLEWDGDQDNTFESNEQFYFFADPRPSKWTGTDFYLLTEEDVPGSRIGSGSGDPSGLPLGQAYGLAWLEQNNNYISEIPAGWLGDHWYWDQFTFPGDTLGDYSFNLPTVNTSQPGELDIWLVGYTDVIKNPDHRVAAYLR
jgi:hypothetical protein